LKVLYLLAIRTFRKSYERRSLVEAFDELMKPDESVVLTLVVGPGNHHDPKKPTDLSVREPEEPKLGGRLGVFDIRKSLSGGHEVRISYLSFRKSRL
jgi:hypothetical protein